jgi:hypothetical protein
MKITKFKMIRLALFHVMTIVISIINDYIISHWVLENTVPWLNC